MKLHIVVQPHKPYPQEERYIARGNCIETGRKLSDCYVGATAEAVVGQLLIDQLLKVNGVPGITVTEIVLIQHDEDREDEQA